MDVYDISNSIWTVGPDAPYAARAGGLAKHNGKIYFCGGFSFGRYLKSLYCFDPNGEPANAERTEPKEPDKPAKLPEPTKSLHKAAAARTG